MNRLPIRPGTARRLGIHRVCPCMAVPQRVVLGFDGATDSALVAAIRSGNRLVVLPDEPAKFTRTGRCLGDCWAVP